MDRLLSLFWIFVSSVSVGCLTTHKICYTAECVEAASTITNNMDPMVSPCYNFYEFVCGNFDSNIFSKTQLPVTTFSLLSDEIDDQIFDTVSKPITRTDPRYVVLLKTIYQACMDTEEIEEHSLDYLDEIFNQTGGWPVVEGKKWNENTFKWTSTIYKFMSLGLNYEMFFLLEVTDDILQMTKKVLKIDQPRRTFASKMNKDLFRYYHDYLGTVASYLGAEDLSLYKEIEDVINLEISINKILVSGGSSSPSNNKMTIQELQEKFSYVPWLEYINKLLHPYKVMTYNDTVVVGALQYFKELGNILKNTPKRTIANFMYWKTIPRLMPYLNGAVRSVRRYFIKAAFGISKSSHRWTECVEEVKRLKIASSALYVNNLFENETKQAVIKLVNYITEQFTETLQTVDWMDNVTRHRALEKAKVLHKNVAYPDELLNTKLVDSYYKDLVVSPYQYLESMLNVTIFNNKKRLQELVTPLKKNDWRKYHRVIDVGTFYFLPFNSLDIPAGALQNIFFDKYRPQYMNFGAIGLIIAHELTHAFDSYGREVDKDGKRVNWWQPKTKSAYDARAQCIIEQYGNISVPELKIKLNGINTLTENIADNVGIEQAYLAYKKWIVDHDIRESLLEGLPHTPEQMFWISSGNIWCNVISPQHLKADVLTDSHVPNIYRLNVPLMNSKYFAKDFRCPIDTPMNPKHKCRVW